MGFYVRTSVKAGPFRFNMSRSGVGVSVGVPGFRVGTGPRGNYIRTGQHGVFYGSTPRSSSVHVTPTYPLAPPSNDVVMEDVTGATVSEIIPSGRDDVVEQLNAAGSAFRWGLLTLIVALILGAATLPWGLIVWLVAAPLCIWLFLRDAAKRKVVLFYDLNDLSAAWYNSIVDRWSWFTGSQRLWRTVSSGAVTTLNQHKRNAGASALIRRIPAIAGLNGPPHLASNIAVPGFTAGKDGIYFLPDRILLRDGKRYTDISYRQAQLMGVQTRFIEDEAVPRDSLVVGETWRYVNKNGGPDRRFSNNRKLPIALYSELRVTSVHGVDWRLQCSRSDAAPAVTATLDSAPLAELA
ncbi:hypothetical protein QE377_002784 [Microbacterium sp. SORGH_AS 862]|nr:hypothetical protein [Microbacterium sp. SORGH_AS_0862]